MTFDSNEDMLDLRDLVKELDDLRGLEDMADEDDRSELERLESIEAALKSDLGTDDLAGYAEDEPTLIRDSYFEEYAQELADDIGAIDKDARWPLTHIDWEAAARELKYDYSAVDIEDVRYWIRSV